MPFSAGCSEGLGVWQVSPLICAQSIHTVHRKLGVSAVGETASAVMVMVDVGCEAFRIMLDQHVEEMSWAMVWPLWPAWLQAAAWVVFQRISVDMRWSALIRCMNGRKLMYGGTPDVSMCTIWHCRLHVC